MQDNAYYTWEAEEYEHKEMSPDWFWAVGIITIVIVILSIIFKNYLFGILIVIGVVCIMYLKLREPKNVLISVTDRLIRINEDERYYQDIGGFWIEHKRDSGENKLILSMKRNLAPIITITIPETVPVNDLRTQLLKHLEERKMTEGKIYETMEMLGF